MADTLTLYESVVKMRPLPIGKTAILTIALPAALPTPALFAIEVSIKDLRLKIVGILVAFTVRRQYYRTTIDWRPVP